MVLQDRAVIRRDGELPFYSFKRSGLNQASTFTRDFRVTPEIKKNFRDRAVRAVRGLEKERSSFGYINDGSGKRYRAGVFFLLAGDLKRANETFDWFYEEFPDDIGEPVFHLYSSLAAHRQGDLVKARMRLLDTMLSNIFMLPHLVGQRLNAPDIWCQSNRHQESYLLEVEEFLQEPTCEERLWIASELKSSTFVTLKDGYLATFAELKDERDIPKRMSILGKWQSLQAEHLGNGS